MEFKDVVQQRRSIKRYDSAKQIDDALLKEIFSDVVLSPSSFNLQHWSFIVVRDPELKSKFRGAAFGQPQVEETSAAILVCGKLDAWTDAAEIMKDAPEEIREKSVSMIASFYDGKPQMERDEAIRGASLAAMSLMYAAKSRGLDTGPMIGFDQQAAAELLKLPKNIIPVMLVVLGWRGDEPRPRDGRRPLSEVVRLETWENKGLE